MAAIATALTIPAAARAGEAQFLGAQGEQAGVPAPAGDFNGDGAPDVIIGAPTAHGGGVAYIVFGPFADGATIELAGLGSRGLVIRGSAGAPAGGGSVAGLGDVNGDGLDDVAIGGAHDGSPSGRAYVVFGRRAPADVDLQRLDGRGITLIGRSYRRSSDHFGARVAGLGDVNGDGLADVGVLAQGDIQPEGRRPWSYPGRAYVILGRRTGATIRATRLRRAGYVIGPADGVLESIAPAGDWNGDGRADVALSRNTGAQAGDAWIAFGRRAPRRVGLRTIGRRGVAYHVVSGGPFPPLGDLAAGDVDGDARPDLVLGTPGAHLAPPGPSMPVAGGGAWVIPGGAAGGRIDLGRPAGDAWELARGSVDLGARAIFVGGVLALAQLDADPRADLVVAAGGGLAGVFSTGGRRAWTCPPCRPDAGGCWRWAPAGSRSWRMRAISTATA